MAEPTLIRLISVLKTQGVFDVYLPFLLTFSIFYGLLRRMKLFTGTKSGDIDDPTGNKISAVVAFVAAAYVTIFSPAAVPISHFFATFFMQSSIALVLLMVFAMVVSMFTWAPFFKQEKSVIQRIGPILAVAGLIILAMFFTSGGAQLFTSLLPPGTRISSDDIALILLVIGTIAIIWALTREEKELTEQEREKRRIIIPESLFDKLHQ